MLAIYVTLFMLAILFMGSPVGFSMLISGIIGLWCIGGWSMVAGIIETTALSAVAKYELLTIPMFLVMAQFVIVSEVADDLYEAAKTWVGRVPGGLAIATAIAGAGFGAISGSSTAAAATLSATTVPSMLRQRYEPKLACGVVAISGTLAVLIPPSIGLVLYGIIADVNIGKLLVAGIVPGLMVTLTIILTVLYLVWRDPSRAPAGQSYSMGEKLRSLKVTAPMIVLFMAVTGVIYIGIATPTEASGVGALGAFLIACWAGKVTRTNALAALRLAASTSCMIFMIIMGAAVFGYFVTLTQATQNLFSFISGLGLSKWWIIFFVLVLYLILGCIMDQIAIMVLTVPIILPVMKALGFDPIWFGIIVIVMAEVGLVTPPLGLNVFVVHRYTGRPLEEIFIGIGPHVVAHLILVAILVIFPETVMFVPNSMK